MFGTTLRQLRLEQNLTQSDMSKALNISRVAYTNYELGNREPDFSTLAHIASLLGTSSDFLLGLSPVRTPAPAALDATASTPLRLLTLKASELSPESLIALHDYVALLKLRDETAKGGSQPLHRKTPDRSQDGNHRDPL